MLLPCAREQCYHRSADDATTPMKAPALILSAVALVAALLARDAQAQALTDNRFKLDLFVGPVLAPIRVTGLAGAYAPYAEGIAGMVSNAAAPGVREPYSFSWFDPDISASISIPIKLFQNDDFDNSGTIDFDYSSFIYATLGGLLHIGPVGLGFNAELKRYSLTDTNGASTTVLFGGYHVLGAVALMNQQLVIGGGARLMSLGILAPDATLTMVGAAPEVGLLIRPDFESFRVGATFRAPVDAGKFFGAVSIDRVGVERAGALILPDHAILPWEIEAGIAVQVGPRPINPSWINPHDDEATLRASFDAQRELSRARHADVPDRKGDEERAVKALKEERRARFDNWPREHLLLVAELLITGSVDRGVGLERFLGQNLPLAASKGPVVGSSGASISYSPRFGIETEPIPDLVATRVGSYYEPSRYDKVGRQHFTFGADLKLLSTRWWGLAPLTWYKLQTSIDLSPRYQSASIGIGVWH